MKKIFAFAIAAVALAVGCQKNQIESPEVDPLDDGTPVEIKFNTNVASVVTKGLGSIEDLTAAKLFVYGVRRPAADAAFGEFEIENVTAKADGTGLLTLGTESEYYFYSGNRIAYDFYGYHVDNAVAEGTSPALNTDKKVLSVPVTIDGSQDILLAKADPEYDMYTKDGEGKPTQTLVDNEVNDEKLVYTAYAARRKVHPTLHFTHALSRFKFALKTGAENDGSIKLTELSLASQTTGTLVIASLDTATPEGLTASGDEGTLTLDSDTIGEEGYNLKANETEDNQETPEVNESLQPLEGAILTYPKDGAYEVTLKLTQKGIAEGSYRQTTLKVQPPVVDLESQARAFEAGKSYLVTIVVYGLENIEIHATLEDWEEVVLDEIDPDEVEQDPDDDKIVTPEA